MEMCPLGPLQETLLLHALSTGDFASTLQQHIVKLSGMYDYHHLLAACKLVVDEQPNLRGRLINSIEGYVVEPVNTAMVALKNCDFTGVSSADREKHLEDFLQNDKDRAFH